MWRSMSSSGGDVCNFVDKHVHLGKRDEIVRGIRFELDPVSGKGVRCRVTALFKTIGRPFKNTRTGGLQILPILEVRLRIRLR